MPWVSDDVSEVQNWLLNEGKEMDTILGMLRAFIPLLQKKGVPLERMLMGTYFVHAQLGAVRYKYEAPHYSEHQVLDRKVFARLLKLSPPDSPFNRLMNKEVSRVRVRPSDDCIPEELVPYIQEKGYTDIYCQPVFYKGKMTVGISYGTKHPGGFSEEQIDLFDAILPALGSVSQFLINELTTMSLLCTYLGKDPGSRVHNGSVDRGDSVTVRSVIWFSDIRSFTSLSQQLDRDEIISLIDQVFELTEEVCKKYGGEILKFMGDGWLVIFKDASAQQRRSLLSTDDLFDESMSSLLEEVDEFSITEQKLQEEEESEYFDTNHVCQLARKAAHEFQMRLEGFREEAIKQGYPAIHMGIGLHYGDVSYGNVGAPSRLDWTVIGPAVNLASRVEGLCKELQASVLATKDFIRRDTRKAWQSAGRHRVKGVDEPVSVYELRARSLLEEEESTELRLDAARTNEILVKTV